ncbi:hypothetical protein [Paraburkholderia terrae]|uniref:hypothetical protein n=1 Tax=Paraburkholderia terrae TaxID=311230 RepID=UPI0012E06B21|nr:hypothetical protein [Paraburkholderia terrae]
MWAKDADLVDRVRRFLGKNFHWHARLSKSGSDLEVVEMLQMMVRGGSVHVIAQEPARVGSAASVTEKPKSSFWGADHYSHIFDVPFAERYRDQLKAMNAGGPTLADIRGMYDSVNAEFMHAAVLADPLGTRRFLRGLDGSAGTDCLICLNTESMIKPTLQINISERRRNSTVQSPIV